MGVRDVWGVVGYGGVRGSEGMSGVGVRYVEGMSGVE